MRRDRDSRAPDTDLTEREVELILAGSPTGSDGLAKLERFVAEMSRATPPNDAEHMATALAATARSTQSARRLRRMATIAAAAVLLMAMSGVAMAADDAAPGDAFYGIDRALEAVGIGDGGVDERLDEFDVLMERDDEERALEFLDEVMADSPEADASEVEQHLEAVVNNKPTAKQINGNSEQGLGSSPGQATSTESRSENQGQSNPEESVTEPHGHAIGQDDEAEPPGRARTNDDRATPDAAGPKDDNSSGEAEEDKEDRVQPENLRNDNDPPGQSRSD